MAVYATTSWQPDDEATSEKLQQMSDNDTWLHDNAIQGSIMYEFTTPVSGPTNLRGYVPGVNSANKVIGIYAAFDWNQPSVDVGFIVRFPITFTHPPICTVTVAGGTNPVFAYLKEDFHNDYVLVGMRYIDNQAHTFNGVMHIIAIGVQ